MKQNSFLFFSLLFLFFFLFSFSLGVGEDQLCDKKKNVESKKLGQKGARTVVKAVLSVFL